ncbi:MAG: 30S ribosomal protein S8 [Candidatus Levybacteria bacterium]|nr:30S ribosomal protein S8 [Candidatus Levybacteria bacterium]
MVSDFLIRIKNASRARRQEVVLPYSNINRDVGKVLQKEGFLVEVKEAKEGNHKTLRVVIAYEKRSPVFSDVKIVSKPSLRVYRPTKSIADVEKRGRHKVVLSTSQGIMSGYEAKKKGVGGEILFEIW